jgi:hypothetical protein
VPTGCLVLNWIDTQRNATAGSRYLASLRTGFDAALQRAADLGEVDPSTATAKTSAMAVAVIGLNTAAHASTSAIDLADLADGLIATIAEWNQR